MRIGFAVDSRGIAYPLEMSAQVSQAYDILVADGMTPDRAAELAVGSERASTWRTPQDMARHIVALRKAARS